MIVPGPYPICEFDADGEPLIKPGDFLTKTLPPKCVVTFFRKELTQLVEQKELPVIGQLHSEVLDIPIYRYSDIHFYVTVFKLHKRAVRFSAENVLYWIMLSGRERKT